MKVQIPDYLRTYQKRSVELALRAKRVLIAHKMGLGKTVCDVIAYKAIDENGGVESCLILCPTNSIYTWVREFEKWYPGAFKKFVIIQDHHYKREALWKRSHIITTYGTFLADTKRGWVRSNWRIVICDEVHRRMRNHRNQTIIALKKIKAEYLWLNTGSPSARGPQDIFGIIHLLWPKRFPSYWKFVNTFCYVFDGPHGKEIEGVRNAGTLRDLLARFTIRATREDQDLPPKIRQTLPIEMNKEETRIYDQLVKDMMAVVGNTVVLSSTSIGNLLNLRQLLVCPKIFDDSLGVGSAIEAVVDHAETQERNKFVIYTPFVKAIPHFEEYLQGEGFKTAILRGGMKAYEVAEVCDWFNTTQDPSVVVVSIKFAESFEFPQIGLGYFIGCEWDAESNEQAEDRLLRLITKDIVNIFYVKHVYTIEEHVVGVVNEKDANVRKVWGQPINAEELFRPQILV